MATFLGTLSLKVRFTILFALVFGVTSVVFSSVIYFSLNDSLLQDFDNALYNYSIDVSKVVLVEESLDQLEQTSEIDQDKLFPFSSGDSLIFVRDASGKILFKTANAGSVNFPFQDEQKKILAGADSSYLTLDETDQIPEAEADSYRLITFPLDNFTPSRTYLQIAVPMTTFESQLERIQLIIYLGLPALLIISILLGLYVASRALRPVQTLIHNSNQIEASQLSTRLTLPSAHDEIRTLAETLNRMLDRIEHAFQSQDRFIADASHQLLTPLTIMRGELETEAHQPTANQQVIKSLLQEIDELTKIIKDMLLLARIESGNDTHTFENCYLVDILLDVVAKVQRLAKDKNLNIKMDIIENAERKHVSGSPDLLHHLFYNLLENAVKFSPQNESIELIAHWETNLVTIDFIDYGPGIPSNRRATIFERFNRAKSTSKEKGFGLGLSIAKTIADLHGFKLECIAKDEATGAHFRLSAPTGIKIF